ncbi:hypothetical protein LTR49_004990 [Elasticomyces elasticus]|nr:hypothetical protein LTR49_004990 [Elasticomyces elasticus]
MGSVGNETPLIGNNANGTYINGDNGTNGNHASSITDPSTEVDFDAIVIGAGYSGIRMMYELKKRGLSSTCFEAAPGVGGTWHYNRYPGARTDSESWVYKFTFLENLDMPWKPSERYPTQPESERYFNLIVDTFGLRKDIRFDTRIVQVLRDEPRNSWQVTTDKGVKCTCRYLIPATGPLATPLKAPFPKEELFRGEIYTTGLWPSKHVDFTGKRVAIVGTGATAVQLIPIVARNASQLTVFQRTPNYVLPARNYPMEDSEWAEIERNREMHNRDARQSIFGLSVVDSTKGLADFESPKAVQKSLEKAWERGGFYLVFQTMSDLLTNPESNMIAQEFVRAKIRNVVDDPATAELLCPKYMIFSKRPPLGHHYYEAFNRPTVKLVDISNNPINSFTKEGLKTADTQYEFDIIILAIGFDAVTGTLSLIDIRNGEGDELSEQLDSKWETAYGITVRGYPNLFMPYGPLAPYGNFPVPVDNTCHWIGRLIEHMRENGYAKAESTAEFGKAWQESSEVIFNSTLMATHARETRSWWVTSQHLSFDTNDDIG